MKITRGYLKTATVLVAAGGLGFGLMGTGVRATFTDGGKVTQSINSGAVGSLACTLSSTDSKWVISTDKHTATLTWPAITSSAAGSDLSSLTVNNTGTVPEVVSWTEAQTGTLTSAVSYTLGSPSMATPVTLAAAANQTYTGLGFSWTALTNADLGTSGSVTYTAACGEVTGPPPYSGPLTFTMGSATDTGPSVGPGNSFQIYGDIHDGATSGAAWKSISLSIPFTLSGVSGDTLSASASSLIGGVWSNDVASVVGSNILVTITNTYTSTSYSPGGTATGKPITYIGANPTYGADVVFGTPVITAST